jgi:hypothetical protein
MTALTVLLPAITTIGGAAIGATVSYLVARNQFRAAVLSKNRQDWINSLRDCLAEYNAILYDTFAQVHSGGEIRHEKEAASAFMRANAIRSKVALLLNPVESDHCDLLNIMRAMNDSATGATDAKTAAAFAAQDEQFISLAQKILKREWERVKRGT